MLKAYRDKVVDRNIYMRLYEYNDGAIECYLCREDGVRIPGASLFTFNPTSGTFNFHSGVDKMVAKDAGIVLQDDGSCRIKHN